MKRSARWGLYREFPLPGLKQVLLTSGSAKPQPHIVMANSRLSTLRSPFQLISLLTTRIQVRPVDCDRQRGDHYIMVWGWPVPPVVIPAKKGLTEDIVLGVGRTLRLDRKEIEAFLTRKRKSAAKILTENNRRAADLLVRAGSSAPRRIPRMNQDPAAPILPQRLGKGSAASALRSILPLGVGGKLCTNTKRLGIIYAGKHCSRLVLTATLSFSAATM